MRATLSDVKLFIIDEISMSSINLAFVHMRLEELVGSSEWFGSRNMLFVVTSSNSHLSMGILFLRRLPPNQYCPNLSVQLPLTFVLVVAWARVPYGSYWHSCDVRPEGICHNCANNAHMVARESPGYN